MPTVPKPETETPSSGKTPYWSWKDDDFIAQGKVSGLAILEIFAAMAFYYWLASISSWPWVMVISFMAVPILLLRSDKSVKEGIHILEQFISKKHSRFEMIAAALIALICYFSFVVWFRNTGATRTLVESFFLGFFAFELPLILWSFFIFSTMLKFTFEAKYSFPASKFIRIVAAVFEFPYLIGLFLRICVIRLWASLKHINLGIAAFSRSYREALVVVDIRHSPALIPQGGNINPRFVLVQLLKLRSTNSFDQIYKAMLSIVLYLPALLYRWNIKASALIWAPIALGLNPTNWRNYTEMREQSSLSSEKWLFYTSVGFLVALATLLISVPHSLSDFISLLPKWMDSNTVISFIPQPNTIRYGLLCLFSLTFAVQLFLAWRMRTQHDKPLSSAADFKPYFEDTKLRDDLDSFSKQANQLHRMLKINTAIAIFTVWAFALKFALDKWPNELQKIVWDWLKPLI